MNEIDPLLEPCPFTVLVGAGGLAGTGFAFVGREGILLLRPSHRRPVKLYRGAHAALR